QTGSGRGSHLARTRATDAERPPNGDNQRRFPVRRGARASEYLSPGHPAGARSVHFFFRKSRAAWASWVWRAVGAPAASFSRSDWSKTLTKKRRNSVPVA